MNTIPLFYKEYIMNKKILITGGTTSIGSAIVREYLNDGDEVTCICRANSWRIDNIPKEACVIDCSLEKLGELEINDSYDVFIHCAWANTDPVGRNTVNLQYLNVGYTIDAVQLAARTGCKAFIGAGSQAEFGLSDKPFSVSTPVNPISAYGIAKYAAERFAFNLCEQFNIKFNWLRILSVYGINEGPKTLIRYLIDEFKEGKSPEVTKCEQMWDYIYCDDCARAFKAVVEKAPHGKVYPLGGGIPKPLKAYVKAVQKVVSPDIPVFFGKRDYYPNQPMYMVADISELKEETGWEPQVSFEEGIKLMLYSLKK